MLRRVMCRLAVADAAEKRRATGPERRFGGVGAAMGHQQWSGLCKGAEGETRSGVTEGERMREGRGLLEVYSLVISGGTVRW